MTTPLFDLDPYGTPCMVCGEPACVCRAVGTLAATPGAWPIDPPAGHGSGAAGYPACPS